MKNNGIVLMIIAVNINKQQPNKEKEPLTSDVFPTQ